jgi:hypothetical protein
MIYYFEMANKQYKNTRFSSYSYREQTRLRKRGREVVKLSEIA